MEIKYCLLCGAEMRNETGCLCASCKDINEKNNLGALILSGRRGTDDQ